MEEKDYGEYKITCTYSIKVKNKEKLNNLAKEKGVNQSKMIDMVIEEHGN